MKTKREFELMSNKELMTWYRLAKEYQCRRYLKAVIDEMNRREKYDY